MMKTPTNKPVHFVQVLLPGFQKQLKVPVAFYRKYLMEKRPKKAVLKGPSGKLWNVNMNGRLFEDGWKEFCEDHDLHVFDFLVFGHLGDLLFDVWVFDRTTCERAYPSNFNGFKEKILTGEEEETPKLSPEQLTKKRKAGCLVSQRDYPSLISVKEEITEIPPQQEEETPKESAGQSTKTKMMTNKKMMMKKGMTKFEGKSGSSASQYPHFTVTLSSYAANCSSLNIPIGFGRANGLYKRCCKVVLLNERGKLCMASLGFKRRNGQAYIKEKWAAFRSENSIKAGDSCIFELIRDGEKPVLKITTLKPNPKPGKGSTQAGSCSRNPRVHVIARKSYMKYNRLIIPSKFAMKGGLARECPGVMTLQNERGRSWTVSLLKKAVGGVRIGLGWSTFASSNGIKAGDVLMLELIKKGEKPVLRISGPKRGAETEKKSSGTLESVKAVAQIKQEANIM